MDRETLVAKVKKEYEDAGKDMSDMHFLFISEKKREDILRGIGYEPAMLGGIQAVSMADKLWMIASDKREKSAAKIAGI